MGEECPRTKELLVQINALAEAESKKLIELVTKNEDGAWVEDFLVFRERYGLVDSAQPLMDAYAEIQKAHQAKADEIYKQSKVAYKAGKLDEAYGMYQQVVDEYYASTWYPKMKQWIADRKK